MKLQLLTAFVLVIFIIQATHVKYAECFSNFFSEIFDDLRIGRQQ